MDLLLRHSCANHSRETIAFSKTCADAIYRAASFQVWVNWAKSFSEKVQDETPAQRLGLTDRKWLPEELLRERLFPDRVGLSPLQRLHYEGRTPTWAQRAPPRPHELKRAY